MKANLVLKNSPSGGVSLRRMARTIEAYSRIWVTGRSILESNQFSTVTWCEMPSPSTMRPSENSSMVAAAWAIAAGVREKIGTTPVPSRTRSLTDAYAVSRISASRAATCVV